MEIKINIEESRFKDIVDRELEGFSKEELHEILKEGLKEYMLTNETLEKIFLSKDYSRWNDSYTYQPTGIVSDLVRKVPLDPMFEEIKSKIIDYVSNEEVLKNAANELFRSLISNGVTNYLFDNQNFRDKLSAQILQWMQPHN